MRSLLSASFATVCLLAVAASAAQNSDEGLNVENIKNGKLMKELHKLHKAAQSNIKEGFAPLKSASRNFESQQAEVLAPVSNEPQCVDSSFATTLFGVFTKCVVPLDTWPAGETFATDAAAKAAWDTFCATDCYADLASKLVDTNIELCLNPQVKLFARASKYMCTTKSTSSQEHCGVTYSRMARFHSCDEYAGATNTACAAQSDVCESYTETAMVDETMGMNIGGTMKPRNAFGCTSIYSSTLVSGFCDGGCMSGYVTELKKADKNSLLVEGIKLLLSLTCGKASDGTYCLPTMSAVGKSFNDGTASTATFDTMCASAPILGCYKRLAGVAVGFVIGAGKDYMTYCSRQFSNVTASVDSYCTPTFKSIMMSAKSIRETLRTLCMKNAAGSYCQVLDAAMYYNPCYNVARYSGTRYNCATTNASCGTSLQTQIGAMGCCAGTLQEAHTLSTVLSADEYPKLTGYTPTATTITQIGTTAALTLASNEEMTSTAGPGFLADTAWCGVTGLNSTLRKRCMLSTTSVAKKLGLKLSWATINANTALYNKLIAAIRSDMANNCGISTNDIKNDKIVEDSSITVTTSASRQMAVQATTTGSSYEFEISAADSVSTTAASDTFDSTASSNSFIMTETSSTVESECAGTCTTSSNDVTTESTSSGVAQLSAAAAAIAAVVLALVM